VSIWYALGSLLAWMPAIAGILVGRYVSRPAGVSVGLVGYGLILFWLLGSYALGNLPWTAEPEIIDLEVKYSAGVRVRVTEGGFYHGCTGTAVDIDRWVKYKELPGPVLWRQPKYTLIDVECNGAPGLDWLKVAQANLEPAPKRVRK
jgi:hypothetical protein